MDFPIFHLDGMGNRMLIAVIAILHVLINHALAVGFIPLIALMEHLGFRKRGINPEEAIRWDELARKMMMVGFIVTTSLGALTGVGIWFSVALVNPAAIGSLIRVFFGAWFVEWLIFLLEVIFIMTYFLSWKKSNLSETAKRRHIRFGAALSLFSWLTMAIITAILGFMMDPGAWIQRKSFFSGVFNPLYIPQLYFRTPLAMMMGGAFGLFLALFFLRKNDPFRPRAVSFLSLWLLIWAPVCAVGAFLYRAAIPDAMLGNLPTAAATLAFNQWYGQLLLVIGGAVLLTVIAGLWGFLKPRSLPKTALVFPLIALFLFLGSFERIREFVRKPFIIGAYMYANGLRVQDYPAYQKDGVLKRAEFAGNREVTPENKIAAGRDVFMIACSRCHTVNGINSVVVKFRNRGTPGAPLSAPPIRAYIPRMHNVWYYMPPFPGNEAELDALTAFIVHADQNRVSAEGAQTVGLPQPEEKKTREN